MESDRQVVPENTDTNIVRDPMNRRKPAKATRDMVAPKATVTPLHIEDMVIKVPGRATCYFKRLKYKGCPVLYSRTSDFPTNTVLEDMHRDEFIRELYGLLLNSYSVTTSTYFYRIIDYIKWLDSEERAIPEKDYWHGDLVNAYMEYILARIQQNLLTKPEFSSIRHTISRVLKQLNRVLDAKNLPSIKGVNESSISHQGLHPETELKPIARLLFGAYKELLKHFKNGTIPERHPLWDEMLADKEAQRRNLKGRSLIAHHLVPTKAVKSGLAHQTINNIITEVAMMITFMFTGMNLTPLSRMKIHDVRFKTIQGGKYILDAEKGRAKYLELDNAMGFAKYARDFIEGWMAVSLSMAGGDDGSPLFPLYTKDGYVLTFNETTAAPQRRINNLLSRLGLPRISSSILRATKSSVLMQVTESIYLVSLSLNNSVAVVKARYANGHKADHRKNLSASMEAQMDIIRGKPVDVAIDENKFKFADILDEYDYQRLRVTQNRIHESRTPLGVRCGDNTKGGSALIRRAIYKAGVEINPEEDLCTDFLRCFECEQHALVADIEGIWLMLSFRDTMAQMQQTPAVNSMPNNQYSKLWNTLAHILSLYQEKSPECYSKAQEKHKSSPHPLYASVQSINDLLEIF